MYGSTYIMLVVDKYILNPYVEKVNSYPYKLDLNGNNIWII